MLENLKIGIDKRILIIPLLVAIFLIFAGNWHRKTEVSAKITSERVIFHLPSTQNSVKLDGRYYVSNLVNNLKDTTLTLSSLEIDEKSTTINELKKVKGKVTVELTPLEGTYYELVMLDKKYLWLEIAFDKPADKQAALGMVWRKKKSQDGKVEQILISPQSFELKDKLGKEIFLAPIREISLRAEEIQLSFENAKVKCGSFEKVFKDSQRISGRIKEFAGPIVFKRSTLDDGGTFTLALPILTPEKDTLAKMDIIPAEISNPSFFNFKDGYIHLSEDKTIDLAGEKDRRKISIKGTARGEDKFEEISVNTQGIQNSFRIKTSNVNVNDEQRQITFYDYLLSHKYYASLIIFLLWFIDKLITLKCKS